MCLSVYLLCLICLSVRNTIMCVFFFMRWTISKRLKRQHCKWNLRRRLVVNGWEYKAEKYFSAPTGLNHVKKRLPH